MSNKNIYCTCILCKTKISTSQMTNHYNSKSCKRKYEPKQTRDRSGANSPMYGKKGRNQFSKARLLGLPVPKVSDETRSKLSKASSGRTLTNKEREAISVTMQRVVLENPNSYRGHYNRGYVKEIIVGDFKVLGNWERIFLEFCILRNIKILQPDYSFSYEFEGRTRQYYPDFYLPEYDLFVEVKGYMDEKSKAKISQFTKNIFIVDKTNIKEFETGVFKHTSFNHEWTALPLS